MEWDVECEEAFTSIKKICTTTNKLAYADFQKPFKLQTDACRLGLGVTLYQTLGRVDIVIGYASLSLSKTEQIYPSHKLEFLVLKCAIIFKFHEYLYGNHHSV